MICDQLGNLSLYKYRTLLLIPVYVILVCINTVKLMNFKNKYIVVALLVVVVLVLGLFMGWFSGDEDNKNTKSTELRGIAGDPVDVTLDFYELWLSAKKSTSTNPFAEGLTQSMALSQGMSNKLSEFEGKLVEGDVDPVLCQELIPDGLRARPIFKQEEAAQLLISATKKQSDAQASVTLSAHDGLWEITDITCGSGENAPIQGEFSFDKEGYLLTNIPAPLDPNSWYLVFEESGVPGHTVALILSDTSSCIATDSAESICSTDKFTQAMKAHVQGDMTEAGVDVKRIEFLEYSN